MSNMIKIKNEQKRKNNEERLVPIKGQQFPIWFSGDKINCARDFVLSFGLSISSQEPAVPVTGRPRSFLYWDGNSFSRILILKKNALSFRLKNEGKRTNSRQIIGKNYIGISINRN